MEIPVPASSASRAFKSQLRRRVRLPVREVTAGLRAVPDVVIAGVQKGGTTPFFRALCAHPQALPGIVKETHYFDRHAARGPAWYRAHFPLEARRAWRERRLGAPVRVVEATPDYVFDPRAPARIARALPEARFVLFLREPVARARSNHRMVRARGYETLGFAEAMDAEAARTAGEWERMLAEPHYTSDPVRLFGYAARSRYADQLERWYAHVPASRTLVLQSERARARPAWAFRRITDFLGIAPGTPPAAAPPAPPYAGLDPGLWREIAARFEDQNRRVVEALGWRPDWAPEG